MGTMRKERGPEGKFFRKASGFCAYTLNQNMLFDCIFTCRTCGYWLGKVSDVKLDDCVSVISTNEVNLYCPNCPEGKFNWRFCSIYSKILGRSFNGQCLRIIKDGMEIRDAWEHANSNNICDCDKMVNYSMLSWSIREPFLCANCTKFFFDETMPGRYNPSFGHLRAFQLNVARDFGCNAIFIKDDMTTEVIHYGKHD